MRPVVLQIVLILTVIVSISCFKLGARVASNRIFKPVLEATGCSRQHARRLFAGSSSGSSNKERQAFYCTSCGADYIKWVGQCTACSEWNTVKEFKFAKLENGAPQKKFGNKYKANGNKDGNSNNRLAAMENSAKAVLMKDVAVAVGEESRIRTYSDELQRVLGGGIVKGSVVLIAGEPGIGKSTLLMQLGCGVVGDKHKHRHDHEQPGVVYISGEETSEQLASRAQRLGLSAEGVHLICDTQLDNSCE
jgi:DNA repair protein RadA/Sms